MPASLSLPQICSTPLKGVEGIGVNNILGGLKVEASSGDVLFFLRSTQESVSKSNDDSCFEYNTFLLRLSAQESVSKSGDDFGDESCFKILRRSTQESVSKSGDDELCFNVV